MDWFLYDNGLRHERVKMFINFNDFSSFAEIIPFSFNLQNTKWSKKLLLMLKYYWIKKSKLTWN